MTVTDIHRLGMHPLFHSSPSRALFTARSWDITWSDYNDKRDYYIYDSVNAAERINKRQRAHRETNVVTSLVSPVESGATLRCIGVSAAIGVLKTGNHLQP